MFLLTGELGDYDPRIMTDVSYVSEFRFIPDQVCTDSLELKIIPAYCMAGSTSVQDEPILHHDWLLEWAIWLNIAPSFFLSFLMHDSGP